MVHTVNEAKMRTVYYIERSNEVYNRTFMVYTNEGGKVVPKWYMDYTEAQDAAKKTGTKAIEMSPKLVSCDYQVVGGNLYDFVMRSISVTTTPRGVESKLHIRVNGDVYEVWTWGANGRSPEMIISFDSLDVAEDYIFMMTYENDFMNDVSRDTLYFDSRWEAEAEVVRRYAALWNVNWDVANSIWRKKVEVERIRRNRDL